MLEVFTYLNTVKTCEKLYLAYNVCIIFLYSCCGNIYPSDKYVKSYD
jgi:hypothetical protein